MRESNRESTAGRVERLIDDERTTTSVSALTEIRGRVSQNTQALLRRGNGCWAVPDPESQQGGREEMRRD